MKVLIDREDLIKVAGLLKYSKNYYDGHIEATAIIENILDVATEPINTINQQVRDLDKLRESLKKDLGEVKVSYMQVPDNIPDIQKAILESLDITTVTVQRLCEASQEDKHRMDKLDGAILEILDIMVDSDCNRGWVRTTTLRDKVAKLKTNNLAPHRHT